MGSLLCVPRHVLNVSFSSGSSRLLSRPLEVPLRFSWLASAALTTSLKAGLRLFFLKLVFKFLFYAYGQFTCTYACAPFVCLVFMKQPTEEV